MSETFYSTDGSKETHHARPKIKIGLFGLVLAIFVTTILMLLGVSRATWNRVDNLQLDFTGLRADNFYWGVRIQSSVRRLNDTLLRYRLAGADDDRDRFVKESKELESWLEGFRTNATTHLEHDFAEKITAAYRDYLRQTAKIQVKQPIPIKKMIQGKDYMFPEDYREVQAQSEALLTLCADFIDEQRTSFDTFLNDSNATLETFQRVLLLSVGLVVGLALMLLMLMYRGMIAPLRRELIESHATIARQEKLASLGGSGGRRGTRNPQSLDRHSFPALQSKAGVAWK